MSTLCCLVLCGVVRCVLCGVEVMQSYNFVLDPSHLGESHSLDDANLSYHLRICLACITLPFLSFKLCFYLAAKKISSLRQHWPLFLRYPALPLPHISNTA